MILYVFKAKISRNLNYIWLWICSPKCIRPTLTFPFGFIKPMSPKSKGLHLKVLQETSSEIQFYAFWWPEIWKTSRFFIWTSNKLIWTFPHQCPWFYGLIWWTIWWIRSRSCSFCSFVLLKHLAITGMIKIYSNS